MTGTIVGGIVALVVIAVIVVVMTKKKPAHPVASGGKDSASRPSASAISTAPNSPSSVREHWLIGTSGDVSGKNFHVGTQTITIGRAANNVIQITDSDASRIHCRIVPVGGSLQIQDMDSSNGIFVNEKKVKRHIFQDQDQLRIGECRFVYHRSGEFIETNVGNKSVSTEILRPTVQYDGEIMTELIVKALQESKGDIARVAEAVDLPVEKVEEIGKKYGVL